MPDQVSREIANLKLQIDALQKTAQAASLPEAIAKMRGTVRWSAVAIAVALVVSSIVRMVSDSEVRELRTRVERLEKSLPVSPAM